MTKVVRYSFLLPVVILVLLSLSCRMAVVETEDFSDIMSVDGSDSVYEIRLNNNRNGAIILNELNNNEVFLVMVNTTDGKVSASVVPSNSVSGETPVVIANEYDDRVPAGFVTVNGETLVRYERRTRIAQSAFLPNKSLKADKANRSAISEFASAQEGNTKTLYADVSQTSDVPTQVSATLKKIGGHCRIWVVNSNFNDDSSGDEDNQITQEQIDALAEKFDIIYPLETTLLGYEYGGEEEESGGMDGDSKIQILICDIDGDYNKPRNGITLGYFNAVDEYLNGTYNNNPSNEAEIFYLDAELLDKDPQTIYSTLIHEFNHMINFNVKVLQQDNNWSNYESWYTEMLSLLAEDVIGPLVEILYTTEADNGNVINKRIPNWLYRYASFGVMQWSDLNPLPYYESNYAFGAYLVRNFGGPKLLSLIAKSNVGGEVSLDVALREMNGDHVTARYALSRFGEALVYSGASKSPHLCSFDKAATGVIENKSYTFPAFDIWDMSYQITGEEVYTGPKTYEYNPNGSAVIPAKGIQLFSRSEWKNQTGSLTIQIQNGSPNIRHYVMIK